jgi:hypothetical protein
MSSGALPKGLSAPVEWSCVRIMTINLTDGHRLAEALSKLETLTLEQKRLFVAWCAFGCWNWSASKYDTEAFDFFEDPTDGPKARAAMTAFSGRETSWAEAVREAASACVGRAEGTDSFESSLKSALRAKPDLDLEALAEHARRDEKPTRPRSST